MLTTPGKLSRVMVYGIFGTACIAGLIAALAMPDHRDAAEAQIAAVYLALLIGSNKAFNAQPLWGFRPLGVIAAFVGTGLLPATLIHVTLAKIAPGQSDHAGLLLGHGMVVGLAAFLTAMFAAPAIQIWQKYGGRVGSHDRASLTVTFYL